MPWDIKKKGKEYCVVKQGTDESRGCHKTRGEAVDQMRALYAAEAANSSSVEFNLGEVDDAIYHLKLAIQLHEGHLNNSVPTNEDTQRNLMSHLEEALAALTGAEETDKPEEAPMHAYGAGDNFEFADGMEEFAWEGPIVFENVTTGDNRVFRTDSIQWEAETLPWAFRWQKHSGQGHAGSVPVGRVDRIERKEDGSIFGFGVVIPGLSAEAGEYLNLLKTGVGGGVSVDGDSAQFDVQEAAVKDGPPRIEFSSMRLRALSAVDIPAFNGARIKLVESPEAVTADGEEFADEKKDEEDKEDSLPALKKELAEKIKAAGGPFKSTPEIKALRKKIADLTPEDEKKKGGFPFDAETEALCFDPHEELAKKRKKRNKKAMSYHWSVDEALVASAIPTLPSTEAFIDPQFDGPTALTVTKDGRVFGHLALFNTCHIGFPGTCTKPPKGSDYRYFHTGEIETAEGDLVETGRLTFGTGHAQLNGTARGAAEHYDNTGSVAADVRAGEDEFGIWVAGALRPSMTDETIREFRAAPLSGDWRKIAGRLELVGALAVNVPGFPVPRIRAMVASGETETLQTFLEGDDESFQNDLELRVNRKIELATKLADLEKEADANKVPSLDDVLELKNPKAPSRKDLEARAENYTTAQIKEDLKNLRQLLDDEEEEVTAKDRKKLEALYDYIVKNGLKGEERTEAAAMELELFTRGIEPEEITASGMDIVEFYNKCHDDGGRFCEGPDGPGRVRDKGKGRLKGRIQPGDPGYLEPKPGFYVKDGKYHPVGGDTPSSGSRPFTPSSSGGGRYSDQARQATDEVGRKYASSRRQLVSATRWAAAGALAFGAVKAGISLAGLIGVAGSPVGLTALGIASIAATGHHIAKSAGYVQDAKAAARKARRFESAATQERLLRERTNRNLS